MSDRDKADVQRQRAEAAEARVKAMQRHFDEAGGERNLLALLDAYHERIQVLETTLGQALAMINSEREPGDVAWAAETWRRIFPLRVEPPQRESRSTAQPSQAVDQ